MMGGISAPGGTHLLYDVPLFLVQLDSSKMHLLAPAHSIPDKLDSQPDLWSLLIPSGVSLSLSHCLLRLACCSSKVGVHTPLFSGLEQILFLSAPYSPYNAPPSDP